jgi:hypothetical protein
MVAALLGALPAIMAAKDAPVPAETVRSVDLKRDRFLLEFVLSVFPAHAAVVSDLDRLLAALHPFRHDGLEMGPGADGLHEHAATCGTWLLP